MDGKLFLIWFLHITSIYYHQCKNGCRWKMWEPLGLHGGFLFFLFLFFSAGTFHWIQAALMPHLCGIIWLAHYFIFPFSPFEFTEKTTKMNAAEYNSILCHSTDARIVVICVNSRIQSCHRATRHESSTCQENLFDFDQKNKYK